MSFGYILLHLYHILFFHTLYFRKKKSGWVFGGRSAESAETFGDMNTKSLKLDAEMFL